MQWRALVFFLVLTGLGFPPAFAAPKKRPEPVSISLFHTNDVHSHFEPARSDLGLGGIARMKTLIDRLRKEQPDSFFLDGGDWSEGQVYYNIDSGVSTLQMMDLLGYDYAVVGNHDWINGPEVLLDVIEKSRTRMIPLAANIKASKTDLDQRFKKWVPPYAIRTVRGVKVAFIGIITYDFIFDKPLLPIKIENPKRTLKKILKKLKNQADLIVGISHNVVGKNKAMLERFPELDLIIGGHDHLKLLEPIRVVHRRQKKESWVVEAGKWGKYIGRVDVEVTPHKKPQKSKVKLKDFRLYAVDETIPPSQEVVRRVEEVKKKIENHYGPIFSDTVAHSEIEFFRKGPENTMGNLIVDAIQDYSQADVSIDHSNFIYGNLPRGRIRSVDVINSNPAVYHTHTQKMWTTQILSISGKQLRKLFELMYCQEILTNLAPVSVAGIEIQFDPLVRSSHTALQSLIDLTRKFFRSFFQPKKRVFKEFKMNGYPIDDDSMYRVGVSGGIYESIEFIQDLFPSVISIDRPIDLGVETWKLQRRFLKRMGTVTLDQLNFGTRIRSIRPDPAVYSHDISWIPVKETNQGLLADVSVRVRNDGSRSMKKQRGKIALFGNRRAPDTTVPADQIQIGKALPLPRLKPGEEKIFYWKQVLIPGSQDRGIYFVRVKIDSENPKEVHTKNNDASRWIFTKRDPTGIE